MSTDDENYEEFVKRYRAAKGEPASGPKFSSVNKQLAIAIALGVAFYLFTSAISSNLDEAIAAQESPSEHRNPDKNPWSKD
jgi:hypothetical protein